LGFHIPKNIANGVPIVYDYEGERIVKKEILN